MTRGQRGSSGGGGGGGGGGGCDALFCIRGGEEEEGGGGVKRKVKMSSDVAAVMKREANDGRQEVGKGGRGEVVKGCALFIPADT